MGDEQCRVDGVCDLIGQIQHKCVEYRESLDGSQSETRGGSDEVRGLALKIYFLESVGTIFAFRSLTASTLMPP